MSRIRTLALALLVSMTAGTVHAAEGRFPLLRCGIKWGGADTAQTTQAAFKKRWQDRDRAAVKRPQAHRPEPVVFKPAGSGDNRRGRLPMSFTLAEFHCSWR